MKVNKAAKYIYSPVFHCLKMSSSSTSVSTSGTEQTKDVSLKENSRKRAREHYKKKYGQEKLCLPDRKNDTVYYIENGMRKVYPYYFNFCTYTKGRWFGRTILDVFENEFSRTGEIHKELIESGRITVNGKKVSSDFILGNNMFLEHIAHRHEMPVLNKPLEVITDTDELIVINKPASIPVHPCGRYRENSITQLLKLQFGYDNLRTLYRLDRLTSGLLIMPKTTKLSKKLESQLMRRLFIKQYVCRVDGKFPDGVVECNEPIGNFSHQVSMYGVDHKNGKPSSTTFTRLSFNGRTSVVKCVPHTGRTHQIRIHLQFLGHPICNDPLYNSVAFGPNKGKGGVIERSVQEIENEIMRTSNVGKWKKGFNPKYIAKFGEIKTDGDSEILSQQQPTASVDTNLEKLYLETENRTDSKDSASENTKTDETIKVNVSDTTVDKTLDSATLSFNPVDDKDTDDRSSDTESDFPSKRRKTVNESENNSTLSQDTTSGETTVIPEGKDNVNESKMSQGVDQCDSKMNEDCDDQGEISASTSKEAIMGEKTETNEDASKNIGNSTDLNKSFVIQDLAENNTDAEYDESKDSLAKECDDCKYLFQDPDHSALILYLHAVSYQGPDWEYSTPLPYWASEDFDERTEIQPSSKCST